MTELDQVILNAYNSQGKQEDVNKVHLTFLRSVLFLPVSKEPSKEEGEPFQPLFAKIQENYYLVVFDTLERLTEWAGEAFADMAYVEITGKDLIAGVNEGVYVGLNVGLPHYKEFSPGELEHLKKIVARIDALQK